MIRLNIKYAKYNDKIPLKLSTVHLAPLVDNMVIY